MANQRLLPPSVAWLYLAGMVTAMAMATAVPATSGSVLFGLVALSWPVAVVIGIRRNRPRIRLPWIVLIFASIMASLGDAGRAAVDQADLSLIVRVMPHALSLVAYVLLLIALISILRAGGDQGAEGAPADAALVAVAAALAIGTFLSLPSIAHGTEPVITILKGAYPVMSFGLALLAARILLSSARRQPSVIALVSAIFLVLAGDLLYVMNDGGHNVDLQLADGLYALANTTFAFAALHPTIRSLTEPNPRRLRPLGRSRLVILAVALATPMIVATIANTERSAAERIIFALASTTLVVMATVRIARSVNTHIRSEARLADLATRDQLTKLPNRIAATEYLLLCLQDAPMAGTGVAALYVDLDRFRLVNDTWGHRVGDVLLVDIATRLRSAARDQDVVARIGGDEFLIICADVVDQADAVELGNRILDSFGRSFLLPAGEMLISVSIGVAFDPGHLEIETEDLIRMADTAMYRAKDLGRGTVAAFDDSMREVVARRTALEAALQQALERNELSIAYQPIVDIVSGATVAFEALLRWNSAQLGSVSPVEFITVAEDTGLIREIGAWVMHQATAQLGVWRRAGAADLALSVNLSVAQLNHPGTADMILGAVGEAQIPPDSLWVEITESVMVNDAVHVEPEAQLHRLRELGIHLAADDFGTGYSSLSYLKRFPFDHVKVDRCFVDGLGRNADDEGIVAAVLAMGDALNLIAVAEGIETELQRERLVALGCPLAQGYLFGRPLTAAAATERLGLSSIVDRSRPTSGHLVRF